MINAEPYCVEYTMEYLTWSTPKNHIGHIECFINIVRNLDVYIPLFVLSFPALLRFVIVRCS